jgi:hypothetical protein
MLTNLTKKIGTGMLLSQLNHLGTVWTFSYQIRAVVLIEQAELN